MKIKTVLILAGGDGDRFSPLEQKVRYRFNGKTVLQHIVSGVSELAEHVIVVTNPTNDAAIKSDLTSYTVQFASQTIDTGGMADAVIAAKQFLTKDVLILNGNDLFDFSILKTNIERTQQEGAPVGIVAKYIKEYFPGGYVRFEGDKAVEIIEKPDPDKKPSEYTNFVADYIPDANLFITELEKLSSSDDQFERALSALMKIRPATCVKYEGDWTTLKYSWHVLAMQEYVFKHDLKKNIDSTVSVHPSSAIEGNVTIGKNTKIGAFVKIAGPCYIGDDVIIGDHSLIRESTINSKAIIGSGCEVARSYLGEGVMLHRNYVGDSVLAVNTSMGAGAVTANYRFDKKTIRTPIKGQTVDSTKVKFGLISGANVKIGVNASTYPGVKLSSGMIVMPGEVVTKDK